MSFGFSKFNSEDAQTTFDSLAITIADLFDVTDYGGSTEINLVKIVSPIKNTMSDMGGVNLMLKCQLNSLRENVIPKVLGN